jgi:hypothetical protein
VRKYLFILVAVLLASCAPLLSGPATAPTSAPVATGGCSGDAGKIAGLLARFDGEKGSLSCDGASLLLNNPGPGAMKEAYIRAEGKGLVLGAPCIARAETGVWGCSIGDVPETQKYRLTPLSGSINKASGNFYRGNNVLFTRVELP